MPVVATTAYQTVADVLTRARAILNDLEVAGGDVLTNSAPFALPWANIAYEVIQKELSRIGVETLANYVWLLGIPAVTNIDPETRLLISDTGTQVITPSGIGGASFAAPQLPTDLIVPLKMWERQNNTANYPVEMKQPNGGLFTMVQQNFLVDWEWLTDAIQFRGALQVQDVKMKYERQLPIFQTVNDPLPIRGVLNAAAYVLASQFAKSRGSKIAEGFGADGQREILNIKYIAVRRKQRKRMRRLPYSGRAGRPYPVL